MSGCDEYSRYVNQQSEAEAKLQRIESELSSATAKLNDIERRLETKLDYIQWKLDGGYSSKVPPPVSTYNSEFGWNDVNDPSLVHRLGK